MPTSVHTARNPRLKEGCDAFDHRLSLLPGRLNVDPLAGLKKLSPLTLDLTISSFEVVAEPVSYLSKNQLRRQWRMQPSNLAVLND